MNSADGACVIVLQCLGGTCRHTALGWTRPHLKASACVLIGILMFVRSVTASGRAHGSPCTPGEAFVPAFPWPWEKACLRPSAILLQAFGGAAGMQQLPHSSIVFSCV